jgi:hypothetical protein
VGDRARIADHDETVDEVDPFGDPQLDQRGADQADLDARPVGEHPARFVVCVQKQIIR